MWTGKTHLHLKGSSGCSDSSKLCRNNWKTSARSLWNSVLCNTALDINVNCIFFCLATMIGKQVEVSLKLNHFYMSTPCKPLQIKSCCWVIHNSLNKVSIVVLSVTNAETLCITCFVILWDDFFLSDYVFSHESESIHTCSKEELRVWEQDSWTLECAGITGGPC